MAWEDEVTLKENLVKSRSHSLLLAFTLTCMLPMFIAYVVIHKDETEAPKTFDIDH